jgi:hypothetical protein
MHSRMHSRMPTHDPTRLKIARRYSRSAHDSMHEYACACLCLFVRVYPYMKTRTKVCANTCMYTCICICVHTCIHACIYSHKYVMTGAFPSGHTHAKDLDVWHAGGHSQTSASAATFKSVLRNEALWTLSSSGDRLFALKVLPPADASAALSSGSDERAVVCGDAWPPLACELKLSRLLHWPAGFACELTLSLLLQRLDCCGCGAAIAPTSWSSPA